MNSSSLTSLIRLTYDKMVLFKQFGIPAIGQYLQSRDMPGLLVFGHEMIPQVKSNEEVLSKPIHRPYRPIERNYIF